MVVFSEVPDEITLAINITNCPNNCKGCHSPWLKKDEGIILGRTELSYLVDSNRGITCVCFMGGDINPKDINTLAAFIKELYKVKTAWYSGKQELSNMIDLDNFDYIKLGPYIKSKGPLNCKTTNQIMYKVEHSDHNTLVDITNKFYKL